MGKRHILGLDIGSSSVRGALFDQAGRMLKGTLVRKERRLESTADGGSELDAERAIKDVTEVVDDVLKNAPASAEIQLIASSCFWHSLVGVSDTGRAVTPVQTWADNRSRDEVARLRKRFNEAETHRRTGARFHSSFWPAKLLWLRKHEPQIWQRTARWLSFSDLLMLRFCGEAATSISMASGTGIFDQRIQAWDAELVRYLKLGADSLPTVDSHGRTLDEKFTRRWPQLKNAVWLPSIADGVANNIGAGAVETGHAALMVGTSAAIRASYTGEPPRKLPSGLWCYRIDAERVIVGGALSDGGGLIDRLRQILVTNLSDKQLSSEIAKRAAAGHGINVMPFFFGERGTGYNEFARGSIHGIRTTTDAVDIIHAAMEAVAYRLAEIFEQLETIAPIERIVASGGALRSLPVWAQIIADVLGRDLAISSQPEASLRGAVLHALSRETSPRTSAIPTRVVEQDAARHARYRSARAVHIKLYDKLMS